MAKDESLPKKNESNKRKIEINKSKEKKMKKNDTEEEEAKGETTEEEGKTKYGSFISIDEVGDVDMSGFGDVEQLMNENL